LDEIRGQVLRMVAQMEAQMDAIEVQLGKVLTGKPRV